MTKPISTSSLPSNPAALQRTLFVYAAAIFLVFFLLLILFTTITAATYLRETEENSLRHTAQVKTIAVEEWLRRAKDTAWQVTSRTRIREELERYNAAEISLDELVTFTEPKLADALNLSPDMIGIVRFDHQDRVVVVTGTPVSLQDVSNIVHNRREITIDGPIMVQGKPALLLNAPIINPRGDYVGSDLVIYDISGLETVITASEPDGPLEHTLLGYRAGEQVNLLFAPRNPDLPVDTAAWQSVFTQAVGDRSGLTTLGKQVIAYNPIAEDSHWALLLVIDSSRLYAPLYQRLMWLAGGSLGVFFIALVGLWMVMRPLAGRLMLRTDELQSIIADRTNSLTAEITHRRQIEAGLRRSEARLKRAEALATMGHWERNLQDDSLHWSDEVYRMLEMNPDHFPASHEAFLASVHPDDRAVVDATYRDSVENQTPYTIEHRLLLPDKRVKFVRQQGETQYDEHGKPLCSIGIMQDITTHKQLEERVIRQEKLAVVGQIAAGVAHDFNNILMGMVGYAEWLQYEPDTSASVQSGLQQIRTLGERATSMVQQLLDFSQQSMQNPSRVELDKLLSEFAGLYQHSLPENIQLQLEIAPDNYRSKVDPGQIQQAIANLVTNASKAMPAGGTLHLNLTRVEANGISCSVCHQPLSGDWLRVTVTDTGRGIAPEVLPHIFEPFFTTCEIGEGTGLGLSQVYGIVSQHDGHITVESCLNKGTSIAVYLPPHQTPTQTQNSDIITVSDPGRGQTILLVENDLTSLETTSAMLEEMAYRVIPATTGTEALQRYHKYQSEIDLVLIDTQPPDPGNETLFARLQDQNPCLSIVLIRDQASNSQVEIPSQPGVAAWIQKPFSAAKLSRTLKKTLRQHKGRWL